MAYECTHTPKIALGTAGYIGMRGTARARSDVELTDKAEAMTRNDIEGSPTWHASFPFWRYCGDESEQAQRNTDFGLCALLRPQVAAFQHPTQVSR